MMEKALPWPKQTTTATTAKANDGRRFFLLLTRTKVILNQTSSRRRNKKSVPIFSLPPRFLPGRKKIESDTSFSFRRCQTSDSSSSSSSDHSQTFQEEFLIIIYCCCSFFLAVAAVVALVPVFLRLSWRQKNRRNRVDRSFLAPPEERRKEEKNYFFLLFHLEERMICFSRLIGNSSVCGLSQSYHPPAPTGHPPPSPRRAGPLLREILECTLVFNRSC